MATLDHIGVYVKDVERSLEFYTKIFDFRVKDRFESGEAKIVLLDIGGGLLELIQRPGSPESPPEGNWSHIALDVPDFEEKTSRLEDMGIGKRLTRMGDGNRLCFFKDLDGHMIELMEKGFG